MSKHTPGPWSLGNQGEVDQPLFANSLDIGNIYAGECGLPQAQANARLIAAAPDLLEALKGFVTWYDHYRPKVSVKDGQDPSGFIENLDFKINRYREVIAKATGGAE